MNELQALQAINQKINELDNKIDSSKKIVNELSSMFNKSEKIKEMISFYENEIKKHTRIKNNIIVMNFF